MSIKIGIPYVFRFRPPNENTLGELKENYIWFSDRDSLNDELDSNPEFVKLSKHPLKLKLLYNTVAESMLDPTFFHNILPIHYVSEIKEREYSPISQSDHIIDLLYKKTEDWSYEKELRLLKDRTGRINFKPSSLLNVLIGYDAEADFINQVVTTVKEHYKNVKVFQVTGPVSIGKLSYKPLYIPK